MRYYFKFIIISFILVLFCFNISALDLEKSSFNSDIHTSYTINPNNNSEYPRLYLGFEDQVENGPFFGKDDISAVMNLDFNDKYLILKIRKRDNQLVPLKDNFEGDHNYIYFKINNNELYYIKWGLNDGKIIKESNLNSNIEFEKCKNETFFEIKIFWEKINYFKNIPLKMNYQIYDYDRNNSKKVSLIEDYVNLYFNQKDKSYLNLHNPLYLDSQRLKIDFELFVRDSFDKSIEVYLNEDKRNFNYKIDKGFNNISISFKRKNLKENNKLTVRYGDLEDSINFYYLKKKNEIKNKFEIFGKVTPINMKVQTYRFDSFIDNKTYKFYAINKKPDVKKLNIMFLDETQDILKFYRFEKDQIACPNLLIYNFSGDVSFLDYIDFVKFVSNKIDEGYKINFIFWNLKKYKLFPYFLKYPLENRFKIYIFSKYDIYNSGDSILQNNLKNYDITFLYNKFNKDYLKSSNLISYKSVQYINQIELFNHLEYGNIDTYYNFISSNIKYNKVEKLEINQLMNYESKYFTCSLKKESKNIYVYCNNIKLFSYPVRNEEKIFINEKGYKLEKNSMNYFEYDSERESWDLLRETNDLHTSIREFFNGKVSALDGDLKTKKEWKKITGRDLPDKKTDNIVYYGEKLPDRLVEMFNIKLDKNGFYTETNRFIDYDKNFIATFRENKKFLLLFNTDSANYFEYPFNYLLLNKNNEIVEGGGVLIR